MTEYWVFGYGSLMWRPDFDFVERLSGRIHGYHRALCVYSWVHRGTQQQPGLVLGLDQGGRCRGICYRIEAAKWPDVLGYLRGREQVTMVYQERRLRAHLDDGRQVDALCYVVDKKHHQYAGELLAGDAAAIVATAHGQSGPNRDYVTNTVAHLEEMGIHDAHLVAIETLLARSTP